MIERLPFGLALTALLLLPLRAGVAAEAGAPPLHLSIDLPPYANELLRFDDIAAHLVLRSGTAPRLIAAFPAGDSGVGVWFDSGSQPLHWKVIGALQPTHARDAQGRPLSGFTVELRADRSQLRIREALLSSVRVLRTYESEGTVPSALRVLPDISARSMHWSRNRLDGAAGYALSIEVLEDGRIATGGSLVTPAHHSLHLRVSALTGEPPLQPLGGDALLRAGTRGEPGEAEGREVLSFLSYREKFLAGSWRFDTYFGRDTLMSLRLLAPVLQSEAVESGLRSVLRRLSDGGEVAHEEAIGEYAILSHLAAGEPGSSAPIYDYGMIDESFMLAPLAAQYLLGSGRARAAAFLAASQGARGTCGSALVRNFLWVVAQTAAFAQHPAPTKLLALKPGHRSGDWRDSPDGLDGGQYPYDVNVALVPAALGAINTLLQSGLLDPYLSPAARRTLKAAAVQQRIWQRLAPPLFVVNIAAVRARDEASAYASALGIDAKAVRAALPAQALQFDALALDGAGRPLPVMHSDEGFTLLLDSPPPAVLKRILTALMRPFPAGLMTPVGLLVADAAYAGPQAQARFSSRAYHGAVVWSWQEALMIAGIDHQLERGDLAPTLRDQLEQARGALWQAVDAAGALRSSELWSWAYQDGHYQVRPFEAAGVPDESDAAQLWSTVFLALSPSASQCTGRNFCTR